MTDFPVDSQQVILKARGEVDLHIEPSLERRTDHPITQERSGFPENPSQSKNRASADQGQSHRDYTEFR